MGSGRLAAVADTGPLIHLAEVDGLAVLAIFDELHIPGRVWLEAQRPPSIHRGLALAKRHILPRDALSRFIDEASLGTLQAGEHESLFLCTRLDVPLLLTDDLAVRRAAKRLGLTPVGSLGIIARAHSVGRLSREDAERHLRNLYAVSSLFVTQAIVELAIERLHELAPTPDFPPK